MNKAIAVIGSGWGDEGKGLFTDYFSSLQKDQVVVRYSGGANAGHTVQLRDGRRHAFSHFGSGSFTGTPTFLSKFFVVNPYLYLKELVELAALSCQPEVLVDLDAPLTTPYDIMLNQFLERARGALRHGSVGVGLNETMVRCADAEFATYARDMQDDRILRQKLTAICHEYVPKRLEQLGLELTAEEAKVMYDADVLSRMVDAAVTVHKHPSLRYANAGDFRGKSVIFEGSQGLHLDAVHSPFFPHVTNARTGQHNIMKLVDDMDIDEVEIYYITRAYSTRHGDGEFPGHDPLMAYADPTNVKNEWQGKMRFGVLDFDLIEAAIIKDMSDARLDRISWSLSMTCMDQVEGTPPMWSEGGNLIFASSWTDVYERLSDRISGYNKGFMSYGPTRDHILAKRKGTVQ